MKQQERALLRRIMQIENTRLLFDGIVELHRQLFNGARGETLKRKCRETHVKICLDNEFKSTIIKKTREILQESIDKSNRLLRQSVNYSFLSFWMAYFNYSMEDLEETYHTISEMVLYYDLLQRLVRVDNEIDEYNYSRDEIPYCYEKLCCYLSEILQCDNCFVFYRLGSTAKLICRSCYSQSEVVSGYEFATNDFSALMEQPEKQRTYLTNDVFQIQKENEESIYVVIRLAELDGQREEDIYLILQAPTTEQPLEDDICPLAKVLFAREHLKNALIEQYEYLLNLRFDCGFIQFFSEKPYDMLTERYPNIMHISDIHMDYLLHNKKNELLKQMREDPDKYGKVDLLVISGDLVEAKYSNASQIQENYEYLKELLRGMVAFLWDRGDGRVSFDWRRRLLIVPGNHDFAAMNLFKTVFQYRTVAASVPAPSRNRIMAKFSYYLDFIQDFLDAPMNELMNNSINEVREYRCMNTKVLLLNSSVGSTAQRINKVTVDRETIQHLTDSAIWKKTPSDHFYRVCVVHHPPFNDIDYVLDGYDTMDDWVWDGVPVFSTVNSLYESMKKAILEIRDQKNGRVSSYGKNHYKEKFLQEYIIMEKNDKIQNALREAYAKGKIYFIQDALLLKEYFNGNSKELTEDTSNMINRILYDLDTSKDDVKEYETIVNEQIRDADVFLCGHLHADRKIREVTPSSEQKERISVIRKFAYDEWEKKEERKPHVRIMRAIWENGGMKIETTAY